MGNEFSKEEDKKKERHKERKQNTERTDVKKEEGGVASIGQGNKQKIVGL
jgi:hypothetical protein